MGVNALSGPGGHYLQCRPNPVGDACVQRVPVDERAKAPVALTKDPCLNSQPPVHRTPLPLPKARPPHRHFSQTRLVSFINTYLPIGTSLGIIRLITSGTYPLRTIYLIHFIPVFFSLLDHCFPCFPCFICTTSYHQSVFEHLDKEANWARDNAPLCSC